MRIMRQLIGRLKEAGVRFDAGMTAFELDRAEECFGFRFPREIREFLMLAVPVGEEFFDYRDCSRENQERFAEFYGEMERRFQFDLENCRVFLLELVGQKLGYAKDGPGFDEAVMKYWRESVRLVPFYAHRCFFDGMNDMPIVSFWQPVDTIVYGGNFLHYLEQEFLVEYASEEDFRDFSWEELMERLQGTGIWGQLIE